mmetsp:Transcript_40321/g.87276  ORF Transcript_40321/g.87276 Transcript_40321/m.87276 type:complete len:222 (+) Transcript_40321:263-928(+)
MACQRHHKLLQKHGVLLRVGRQELGQVLNTQKSIIIFVHLLKTPQQEVFIFRIPQVRQSGNEVSKTNQSILVHQGSRSPQRHVPRLRRAQGPGAGGQRGAQRSTEALLGQAPAAVAEGDVEPPKAGHLIGGPGTGKAHATTLLQHVAFSVVHQAMSVVQRNAIGLLLLSPQVAEDGLLQQLLGRRTALDLQHRVTHLLTLRCHVWHIVPRRQRFHGPVLLR